MAIIQNPTNTYSHYYVFCNKDIILHKDHSPLTLNDFNLILQTIDCKMVFAENEYDFCTTTINDNEIDKLTDDYICYSLRLFNTEQSEEETNRTLRAKALNEWLKVTRFCSRCGQPLYFHKELTALQCSKCNNLVFPRIEPCIIVLVKKGDKMLLAKHAQRNQDIYACIAGFMEVGENAEQAVKREILEETGITVKNVKYFGTQSWPYPSQLMIAFTAEYESGDFNLQEDEIADAGWFTIDNSPATPQPGSIAYQLIHSM